VGVKQRIMDTAAELFARYGYDGASVSMIVKAAGVSKGAFFHYWKTKEDLLAELIDTVIKRIEDGYRRIKSEDLKTPIDKLTRVFEEAVHVEEGFKSYIVLFMRLLFDPENPVRDRYIKSFWRLIEEFIENELGLEVGSGAALMILSTLASYTLLRFFPQYLPKTSVPSPREMATILYRGISSVKSQ